VLKNALRAAPSGASDPAQRILAQPRSETHQSFSFKTMPVSPAKYKFNRSFLVLFFKKEPLALAY
jgi:hypothetical protein